MSAHFRPMVEDFSQRALTIMITFFPSNSKSYVFLSKLPGLRNFGEVHGNARQGVMNSRGGVPR
jgi:hypothetical protein